MRRPTIATVGLLLSACCPDDVGVVSVAVRPDVLVSPSYAWVGDTVTMHAVASTDPTSLLCAPRVLYTAETAPQRFSLSSTDPSVATIDARAVFTARTVGVTRLVVRSAGISDSVWIIVAPAFASLRITVTPAVARVGDTVSVQVEALDANGTAVPGAQVQRPALVRPSDGLATWLPSDRAAPPFPSYTFPAPVIDRLLVQHAGVLTVFAAAPHDSGRPLRYVADSILIIATAR